jgi:Winged helix-turn helix
MPFPFADAVSLSDPQRAQLEALVRAGSTPQALAFRCRLILRAADKDNPPNLQIAAEFSCDRHTVAAWRNRYLEKGLAGLQDAPRSGRPRRFSPLGTAHCDQPGQQYDRSTGLSRHPLGVR